MKSAFLAAALALTLAGCTRREPLPVYGQVPHFSLISQSGRPFDSRTLDGKVWVANFFFSRCLGPCPRMSSQMHWVQKQVADVPGVRLVSFTVDPEHDTPLVLASYAQRFRADSGRWHFLTGQQAVLNSLDRDTFHLGNVDGTLQHATRFVLIDRQRRIRGYYRTDEGESLAPLVADIRRLAKEQP